MPTRSATTCIPTSRNTSPREDQRWTPARIRVLIAWKFSLDCSSAGVWRLLHRHRWCRQSPARRALERDEHAVDLWKKDVWPQAD
ncbi:winged helix-turn-helix domain-containing protein [Streptomyces sviceus]|uniref:helix-turn-helix domain-containing protein n=1 Tax=Streptomyces sviceus TaxID=285530 RepID=UPI0036A2A9F7